MYLLKQWFLVSSMALGVSVGACNFAPLNVKFVEPQIASFKGHGNRVAVAEGSLDGDVLAIEIMKNGKFVLASRELAPAPVKTEAAAVPAAAPAPSWGPPETMPLAMPGPKMPSPSPHQLPLLPLRRSLRLPSQPPTSTTRFGSPPSPVFTTPAATATPQPTRFQSPPRPVKSSTSRRFRAAISRSSWPRQ